MNSLELGWKKIINPQVTAKDSQSVLSKPNFNNITMCVCTVLHSLRIMYCVYLMEASMENPLHLLLIKRGFLDLSSGVLVVE